MPRLRTHEVECGACQARLVFLVRIVEAPQRHAVAANCLACGRESSIAASLEELAGQVAPAHLQLFGVRKEPRPVPAGWAR